MAVISLTGVTVEFDSTKGLDHINLRVEPGEVLSIIGPNGAGKTTLLRVMAGLQRPSSGLLSFRGRAVTDTELPEFRRRVTMVFQKPILFGTTVFNNVAYGLRIRGVPETEVEQRVTAALEEVGMDGLAGRQARTLSGGEQKRVALAMATVTQPDVLLLDEPTAYLDRDGVALVDDLVRGFRREGRVAVAIATHDILRVAHLSDQTLFLDAGRIRAKGPTREVIREELESLAFGDLTSNLFRGTVVENGTGTESGHRLSRVRIGHATSIDVVTDKSGDVTVRIPPEDIIVSREPVLSSARNSLRGTVTKIEAENSTVLLTVDIGIPLVALITKSSLERLKISQGDSVCVTFKASSVRVY